jgi:GTP cyclohydrolase I
MLPFAGVAAVGYVPADGLITGLSKLPRAVHALAQRLQVQERLTAQIADAIDQALAPQGCGVVLRAVHSCAELRGVRVRTPFVTSVMRGSLFTNPAARQELLALTHGADL